MNDYFSNLIVRSLQQSNEVQPRLTARFEPVQPNSLTTAILEQENIVQVPFAPPTSSQETSDSYSSTASVSHQVATPNSVQAEGRVSPIESEPEPIVETSNVEQRILEPTAAFAEVASQDSPQPHSVSSQTVTISKLITVNSDATTSSPQLSPQIPLAPASLSPLPTVQSQPPVIRVTIGRIDVRAVAPSTPTRRPTKPPTPQLSLADYLKAQDGGQR